MWDFLSNPFADNTAQDWIIAAAVFVVVVVVVRIVIGIGLNRLRAIASKTETDVDDLVTELLEKTKFLFVALVALYAAAISLTLPPEVDDLMSTILVLGFLLQAAFWANGIVNYMLGSWARQRFEADPTISTAVGPPKRRGRETTTISERFRRSRTTTISDRVVCSARRKFATRATIVKSRLSGVERPSGIQLQCPSRTKLVAKSSPSPLAFWSARSANTPRFIVLPKLPRTINGSWISNSPPAAPASSYTV